MGYRNITVSDEIYSSLASLKKTGESFNTVLHRLISREKKAVGVDLSRFIGTIDMTDEEAEKINKEIKNMWKTWRIRTW